MKETSVIAVEETESAKKPSNKRQIAAVATTTVASVALGLVAQAAIGYIAGRISKAIIKPEPEETTEDE